MKKVLMMLAVVAMVSSMAIGSPYVTVKMLTSDGADTLTVKAGDVVSYKLVAILSPIGTTNSSAKQGATFIPSITSLVQGTDGIQSARFNIYQNAADPIQVSFTGAAELGVLSGGTGASGGTLAARGNGFNDLGAFKAVDATGAAIDGLSGGQPVAIVIGTGSFTVMEAPLNAESTVNMTYLAINNMVAQSNGGFKVNGGKLITSASIAQADPVYGYQALTLQTIPEPVSIVLLALGGLGLLRRKS